MATRPASPVLGTETGDRSLPPATLERYGSLSPQDGAAASKCEGRSTRRGPAIVIDVTREDWPGGGPRTLTPLDPNREPNRQTFWFGAELAPDDNEVWFRPGAALRPWFGSDGLE